MRLDAILQAPQLKVEFGGCFFRQTIDHPFLVAPANHEAVGPEIGEML